MSELQLPGTWATDTNFSSGPSSGSPTKVDPGAAGTLQGFVPGVTPFSPAQLNHLLNRSSGFLNQFGAGGLLTMRNIHNVAAMDGTRMLLTWNLSTYGVQAHMNQKAYSAIPNVNFFADLGDPGGPLAKGVAQTSISGGRMAFVADSATPLGYSDNNGATWTTVASANAFGGNNNAQDIGYGTIWGACVNGVTNAIYSSSTAAASSWTSRSLNGTAGNIPMRIVGSPSSGRAIVVGVNAAGTGVFVAESANGTVWASASAPAGAVGTGVGSLGCAGDICYDPFRERFWWLTHTSNGIALHYSSTSGALSWTTVYTKVLGVNGAQSVTVDPLLGVVYILAVGILGASLDGGLTWTSCSTTLTSIAAAPGVLYGYDADLETAYVGPFLRGPTQGNL